MKVPFTVEHGDATSLPEMGKQKDVIPEGGRTSGDTGVAVMARGQLIPQYGIRLHLDKDTNWHSARFGYEDLAARGATRSGELRIGEQSASASTLRMTGRNSVDAVEHPPNDE